MTSIGILKGGKWVKVDLLYLSILISLIFLKVFLFLYQGSNTNWLTVGFFFSWKVFQFLFFFFVVTPILLQRVQNEKYLYIILYNYIWTVIFSAIDIGIFRSRFFDFPSEFYQLTLYFQIGFFLVVNLIIFHISSVTFLRIYNEHISIKAERVLNAKKQLEIINNQQQIGPHYLSNTLNNLQRLIRAKDWERAADYNASVHELFSTQVGFVTKESISIEEEINWLKCFIKIEEERLGRNIDFQVELSSEELMLAKIPVLLLQPIIENSIVHGFPQQTERPWKITLQIVEVSPHTIQITTSDNGIGNTRQSTKRPNGGVGIANIRKRIQLINEIGESKIRFNQTLDQHGSVSVFVIKENKQ